jgi:hypothetical protein
MKKVYIDLLLILSILASLLGLAAFLFLFIPGFNVFTLIVSPIIIACYQAPAAVLFGLYRKLKKKHLGISDIDPQSEGEVEDSPEIVE